MQITHDRGYLIPAIGDVYKSCADQLVRSIREFHPDVNITIVTEEMLPHGDLGGFNNDWQMFEITPYRQTIKLEADMVATSPIDHWWTLFEHRDVVISQCCRNFYGQPSRNRYYRKFIDENRLPDVYNAITYWRLSQTAKEFFELVRNIFENWNDYRKLVKFPEDHPSTDFVYAMAAQIMGPEQVTLPMGPSIVHMKQHIIGTLTQDWTKELVWEYTNPGLRIQTVAQSGLVHYNIKEWRMYEQ